MTTKIMQLKRLRRVANRLRNRCAALLISSAPTALRSPYDSSSHYRYFPDSDFFYLTGSTLPALTLFVDGSSKPPILVGDAPTATELIWQGRPVERLNKLAQELQAELCPTTKAQQAIRERLVGTEALYFQNTSGTFSWNFTEELITCPPGRRRNQPATFHLASVLLAPLRQIKDGTEIKAIKQAVDCTYAALRFATPLMTAGTLEREIAATIEYCFDTAGGQAAFPTIVAAGSSAAALHYEHLNRPLRRGQLLLIDCGAHLAGYAGDISRVFPVNARFTSLQRDLYELVRSAQSAAIKQVKPGTSMDTVERAAVRVLAQGLIDLQVLQGSLDKVLELQSYRPYFPHRIGHLLGMDVHDVRQPAVIDKLSLKSGMVITIEPGLYFAKKVANISACGLRLEDDVLVTRNGCQVLSKAIPRTPDEIETFMGW